MRLQNKVALVTGAADGIGRAVAARFASEGASVCIVDIQEAAGQAAAKEIQDAGGQAQFFAGDVSSAEDTTRIVDAVVAQFGRVDILINNAAMAIRGTVLTLSEAEWDRQLNVNLKSIYLYARAVIPVMARNGGGVILNMGSVTSLIGVKEYAAYVASKAGIAGITRALAIDHAEQGIRSVCICPGGIETPLMELQYRTAPDPAYERQRVLDLHPIGRLAKPAEVAGLLVYLASDEASYITGALYSFDGGYTTR